ncbi:hypothetical protein B0H17DRAFT_1040057 [Mycena rosella]|uniref:Uncharacterized protein n=1 Tax=Mycena rosella TaxID=1033263 RepID=A0AAD7GT64_MYCRO|nr:hypothetical protein B0H17DRAFT_1040057 [Mycena rosella]
MRAAHSRRRRRAKCGSDGLFKGVRDDGGAGDCKRLPQVLGKPEVVGLDWGRGQVHASCIAGGPSRWRVTARGMGRRRRVRWGTVVAAAGHAGGGVRRAGDASARARQVMRVGLRGRWSPRNEGGMGDGKLSPPWLRSLMVPVVLAVHGKQRLRETRVVARAGEGEDRVVRDGEQERRVPRMGEVVREVLVIVAGIGVER